MNNWFKQNGTHLAIIGLFIVLCCAYLTPALQGKVLGQNDVTRAQSTQKEIMDYREKGTTILWTNQILGGMPVYQIWAPYSANIAKYVVSAVDNPICTVLLLMAGAYFLFVVLGLNPWLAAGGALAFTFSSYNFIYLVAGHANQEIAIAFFAPIIASVILTLRGKHWWGSALLALFLALEIKANHIQMTYYLLIALIILMIFELVQAVKSKQLAAFGKSVAYMAAALALAIGVNASVLWSTAEYAGDSIRGKSNLTNTKEPAGGVPRDYAYEFSQGVSESLSFLVPNIYGGSSAGPTNSDSNIARVLIEKGADPNQAQGIAARFPLYWGDKTFTEGPWYFGAIVCFFFIFGLLAVRGHLKWWILATVVLTMLLSFGRNFPFVSDIFFNYFPLYNKFRAVESILAVTMLCFPILAFLAINQIIQAEDKKPVLKKLLIALYITGGITLVIAALPDAFLSFKPANHKEFLEQLTQGVGGDAGVAQAIAGGLVQDRIAVARADAFRTLIFIALAFGLSWAFIKQKVKAPVFAIGVLVLVVVDMWTIDKRYLKDDSFASAADVQKPQPREIDQFILRDTDPDYRVVDLTVPLLQDSFTPYFHKSVGGYSAARMKRFDELVENQLSRSVNQNVLDMLNTKYIITSDPKTQSPSMHKNETACGHAWFVSKVRFAENADQEMQVISAFSPKEEAIVDKRYSKLIDAKKVDVDPSATITLTSYAPDRMVYQSGSTTTQIAVFSEIYYDKGWKMYIDKKEQPYFRADYVLRAAQIPVGNHEIVFEFHPASYYAGEKISLASSVLLVLSLGGAAYAGSRRKKNDEVPVKK